MKPNLSQILILAVWIALLGASVFMAVQVWNGLRDVELSTTAYIGMAIGTVATLGLGGGLMALVFYSSRHGYDDRAGGVETEGIETGDTGAGDVPPETPAEP